MQQVREDETDPRDNHIHWWQQLNPVTTEALIQLTLGAPQLLYNGGLLWAPLRYFDAERERPGLPPDVGALVETVSGDQVVLQLVNLSAVHERQVLVQAGTLGEHRFTQVKYNKVVGGNFGKVGDYGLPEVETALETVAVDGSYVHVELPPGTEIRLVIGLERHVQGASYRLPWQ